MLGFKIIRFLKKCVCILIIDIFDLNIIYRYFNFFVYKIILNLLY